MTKCLDVLHRFGPFAYPVKVAILFAVFHFQWRLLPPEMLGALIGPCGIALGASIIMRVRNLIKGFRTPQGEII